MINDPYVFPGSESLVVCGDIHGDFSTLVNKICVQYQLRNTVVIVAGDCGFGFEKKGYYETVFNRNAKRMNEANNWIVFMRGNHDNPAYFYKQVFHYKRFVTIPDYSIVRAGGHNVLCIGGAISVDRVYRKSAWESRQANLRLFGRVIDNQDPLAPNYYWRDEAPVFNEGLLMQILNDVVAIDAVITHAAPSFCELMSKDGIRSWMKNDDALEPDLASERSVMDATYDKVKGTAVTHWCYGHFHQSWHATIEGILFKMLDIMELYSLP